MKNKTLNTVLATLCVGLLSGLSSNAAEKEMKEPSLAILSDAKADAQAKMDAIDAYVRSVEKEASSLTRKEEKLSADELKKVTDEKWTKVHTYSAGSELKRMKMYAAEGSTKTEEFYYHNGQPIFVFLEANGAGKENHDTSAKGDKFYFANGKLIGAQGADGKAMDVKSADTAKQGEKLAKESKAFRAVMK